MEQEQDGTANSATGVTRGQNRLHVLPEDWRAGAEIVQGLLDRLEAATVAAQLLVLTSDAESAAGIATVLATPGHDRGLRVLSATDTRRGTRVLREAPAHVVVAPLDVAVALQQSATLKLETLRIVVLAWLDARDARVMAALESLMADAPKDTARVVLADVESPELDQLVERYARRAHRAETEDGTLAPVSLEYLATNRAMRLSVLRQLLDALDPESAFVATTSPDSLERVQALLHAMGYETNGAVRAGRTPPADARVVILFDMPARAGELPRADAGATAPRVIALVAPRQLDALRRIAGGPIAPLALPDAAARARTREDAVRDELRAILSEGRYARELLALEPLLADYDGAEIAAAALRLLDAERAKANAPRDERRPAAAGATGAAMTRLYINTGSMDDVRPTDIVGAIVNEAGIARTDVGKVEVRERFSTVEVATSSANTVVSKLTGVSIRGRRVLARVDERGERGPSRDRGDRGDRPDRGNRGGRGERDRGERSDRGGREREGARPRSTAGRRPFPKRT